MTTTCRSPEQGRTHWNIRSVPSRDMSPPAPRSTAGRSDLDLPRAVLGVLDDLHPGVLVAKHQRRLAVLLADPRLAPLVLEQVEQRVARLGVRPPRQREAELADRGATAGRPRDSGRRP